MKIIPLSEGSFTVGANKTFNPVDNTGEMLNLKPDELVVEVQPFCIVTQRDIIVIDTGLGFRKNGTLQLIDNLRNEGIDSAEVTKVLMSHLHKDHAGGISLKDRLGNQQVSFPNATYFVQRREFDYAEEIGYPGFISDQFYVFDNNPKVFWLLDDEGTIDNYIRYQVTAAHSPFHQVFWIEEDGEIFFFGGDDGPQEKQMITRFVAKYDYDGRKAMQLRQQWWAQGSEEGWTFLFYHDTKTPVKKAGL